MTTIKPKVWDEYEIKARYIPTFLSIIPLTHFLITYLGEKFFEVIIENITWMLIIQDFGLSLILMLSFVQVQCFISKYWIEESIFGKGGKNFPTTEILLFSNNLISLERKKAIREKIEMNFKIKLPDSDYEVSDQNESRLRIRESISHVRKYVGKGIMTHQYNIRYGFFRNLIGGILISIAGSIGCSALYYTNQNWKLMSFFLCLTLLYLVFFIFRKKILESVAFSYADTLFNEFLNQNKGEHNV
jgi:hypothetical protein